MLLSHGLADLNLSIDGQRTSDEALRDLAETVTGDRWLALGAAGTARSGWHPERWTHRPVTLSGHDIDPAAPLPQAGCSGHPPPAPTPRCRSTCPTAQHIPCRSGAGTADPADVGDAPPAVGVAVNW